MSSRDRTRAQLVEVAAELLATEGPDAVTTRSVALAAGVQAPTIYRLFGDKSGLLDAVVEHGFASYVAGKHLDADADPVGSLRAGWELHVGFGLANPELFRLMHTALRTPEGRAAAATGIRVLQARVHRVAEAGRLRVTERRAVELIHAAGTGVVFTLIDQAGDERDDTLADTAWESVCAAILTDASTAAITSPAAAAGIRMLQARLHRVAEAGRLRVTERRAAGLIHAVGTGVVFTLIDQTEDERDETLADTAWESVCAAILTDASTAAITGPAAAAVTLRAALPDLASLTAAERALLGDWLDRIAESRRVPG